MSDDHVGCLLAIVGSRHFAGTTWRRDAEEIIADALYRHRPVLVISGGAIGIDKMALAIADHAGFATSEIKPTVYTWDAPGGLRERNTQISEGCQCLVRIGSRSSTTYGSAWTADHAEAAGKNVERYEIGEELPHE